MKTKIFLTFLVRRSFSVGVFFLLFVFALFSQAPQGFNYQAVARDGDNGVLKNVALDVKIGLLQGSEAGSLVWEEIHSVTTNDLGLFTLIIGDTTATYNGGTATAFADIDWSTGSYFMKVQIDDGGGGGYVDMGSAELLSVPYALFAESSKVDSTNNDVDPFNEIQDLQLTDNDLIITNNASATTIDLSPYIDNTDSWITNGDSVYYMGSVGVGTSTPQGKMAVQGDDIASEDPLFEVKREDGQTVFAVYNEGVRIYVDTASSKGLKGGFAVGGFSASKGISQDYMRITPDSIRMYLDEESGKGLKGGFAVGGFGASKAAPQDYLRVTPDSVRVYIDETISKGLKGGFAVGGFGASKAAPQDYLRVTPDSVRVYINDTISKGLKGGFAVGGFGASKGSTDLMHLNKDNYFIGHNSGSNTTTGTYNSFFGYQAGMANSTGNNNVFLGYKAGTANVSANENIFIGYQAGTDTAGGNYNVVLGSNAGYKNNGHYNVFIGYESGYNNIGGADSRYSKWNTFIGYRSGKGNTTGWQNLCIGYQAGLGNQSATNQFFIGNSAGKDLTDGYGNTFVGHLSGQKGTDCSENTFIGYQTGWNNLTGDNNTFLGYAAGIHSIGSGNVFIGGRAGYDETTSNKLYIENSSADENNALIYGDFDGDYLRFNANVGIGRAPSSSYGLYVSGGTSYEMRIVGDAHASGTFYSDSDIRLKKNINNYKNALDKILQIRGVSFEWRREEFPETDYDKGIRIGVIAQEVEKVFPELVSNDGEYKAVAYSKLSAVLVEAIKEQQKQIEELRKEIEALKKESH